MGALNPDRLKKFKQRFNELQELFSDWLESLPEGCPPPVPPNTPGAPSEPFLYGCHYSTPGYVVFFKMRNRPQLMLRLQNGRFDMPDRLFTSMREVRGESGSEGGRACK